MRGFSRQDGFTLVELLVTTSIIGILAGLAIVNYDNYREKIYQVELQSAAHNGLVALSTSILEARMNFNTRVIQFFPNQIPTEALKAQVPGMPHEKNIVFTAFVYGDLASRTLRRSGSGDVIHCKMKNVVTGGALPNTISTAYMFDTKTNKISNGTSAMYQSQFNTYCAS